MTVYDYLKIDRQSGTPIYQQLLSGLERFCRDYPPETPIPPERDLSKTLGVSRTTLRQALREKGSRRTPQEQKQGGASAPPCPYSLVLCRHIRPACPVCYPWVARVWARLWNFSLSTTTRSWVPSPMGPASS